MKRTVEELNTQINSLSLTEEEKLSLMADITDSLPQNIISESQLSEATARAEAAEQKYNNLVETYKERFLNPSPSAEHIEPIPKQQKQYIDIKEI